MKILVTGGAGFIGTNLIKRLLKDGHEVHSLDNYDSGLKENEQDGCIYHTGDVRYAMIKMDKDFNVVFHLAALSRIQPSFNNPSETYRVNTNGTERVLVWAKMHNVKVLYAGSSSRHHNPYQSPYATCKYLGEELCKMYKKTFGVAVDIVRFYNVYGPHEIVDGDWAAVTGIWRRQIRDNEPLTIVGNGEQRRDFTHVDDVVDGLVRIMFKRVYMDMEEIFEWELGTGLNYSINEVSQMFMDTFDVSRIYIPNQRGNYRETIRINNDAITELDWKPTDQLETYIKSLRNNK